MIYECIEYLVNIPDVDIPDLSYLTYTKTFEPLSKVYHNIISIFVNYVQYQIHDNDSIGDHWLKVTSDNFN